jgi:N-dimethylarginine dimethylaminohydrolase
MSAPMRRVLVRCPAPPASEEQWRSFGFARAVNQAQAREEHSAFVQILTDAGVDVEVETGDAAGMLDAIFSYDPSIMTDRGAILLRPGKRLREAEVALHEATYARLGIPIAGRIEPPGTVEGGDTLWLDERTLSVGRGYRTNDAGVDQLRAILAEQGVSVMTVELPHWHGPEECLHLMSVISPVAPNIAVVYPPLMPVSFLDELRAREWRLVEVPDSEFLSLGCNVLALDPETCLMIEGNATTHTALEALGHRVLSYLGDEISHNREGGPTCLTRPILRES